MNGMLVVSVILIIKSRVTILVVSSQKRYPRMYLLNSDQKRKDVKSDMV